MPRKFRQKEAGERGAIAKTLPFREKRAYKACHHISPAVSAKAFFSPPSLIPILPGMHGRWRRLEVLLSSPFAGKGKRPPLHQFICEGIEKRGGGGGRRVPDFVLSPPSGHMGRGGGRHHFLREEERTKGEGGDGCRKRMGGRRTDEKEGPSSFLHASTAAIVTSRRRDPSQQKKPPNQELRGRRRQG